MFGHVHARRTRASIRNKVGLATLLVLAGIPLTPAAGQSALTSRISVISGADPFAATHCGFAYADSFLLGDERSAPFEPEVAVNPAHPDNIVVAYIQDDFLSDLVVTTKDGGRSWRTSLVPGLSKCTGGANSVAADPSVVFSSDGRTVYLAALAANDPYQPVLVPHAPSSVIVSRSLDGGTTWTKPLVVKGYDGQTGDMNRIASDPSLPGTAYLTWPDVTAGSEATGSIEFSRTDDSGQHWSAPTTIFKASDVNEDPTANRVLALGHGALVDVFVDLHPSNHAPGPYQTRLASPIEAVRSSDGGHSWSAPIKLGECCTGAQSAPAATFLADTPSVAMSRSGELAAVWPEVDSAGPSKIFFSKSLDGGRQWSSPRAVVSAPTEAAMPALAITDDETIAMTYYELRATAASGQSASADFWAIESHDGGQTWSASTLAGPFDINADPRGGIEDYSGLAAVGRDSVVASFELTKPLSVHGPTDIFYARLSLGDPRPRVTLPAANPGE